MTSYIEPSTLRRAQESAAPPVIIDVRGQEEYAAGHIPGALHIPADELPARLDEIPHDRPIVSYCNMHHPGSSRGERTTAQLRQQGYDARTLEGGLPSWKAAGYPTHAD